MNQCQDHTTISRCTSLVVRHVKRHRYRFALHFPRHCFVRYGPPKSTPIRSNARKEGVTLDLGSGAII